MIKPPTIIRDGTPGDMAFLVKAWLSQQRKFSHHVFMTRERFMAQYRGRIERLLPKCRVRVVANAIEPDVLYAICAYTLLDQDLPALHFLATKFQYQNLGMATELLSHIIPPGESALCTSWSEWAQAKKEKLRLIYDPYFERTIFNANP